MLRSIPVVCSSCAVVCLLAFASTGKAARPSEQLVPATTKGYVSIPDVDLLAEKWDQTQLGQLTNDPAMQPFAEDLKRQLKNKLSQTGVHLGLTWDDLDGVYGGEVAVAVVQPNNDEKAHAIAMCVDVTGHLVQARDLLVKVEKNKKTQMGVRTTEKVGNVEVMVITMPKEPDQAEGRRSYYFIHQDQLVAVDHRQTALDILRRMTGDHEDTLEDLPAFAGIMARCRKEAKGEVAHIRWFVEPFGYVEVSRAADNKPRKRGKDMLKILSNQGFDAIQGLGGLVSFATEHHELLHYTMVWAPKAPGSTGTTGGQKYKLAAQMLDFPNGGDLLAQSWITRELATYLSFHWKVKEAFYHSKTLVNEIANDDVFDAVLDGLRDDPNGPQIDIRNDLIPYLGERATLVTDCELPITPKSERMLLALNVTNVQMVAKTIDRAMESDPDARKLNIKGHTVWEMVDNSEAELPTLMIDGLGGELRPIDIESGADDKSEEEKPRLRNWAITVANGHILAANHVDLLAKILDTPPERQTLGVSTDYQTVMKELDRMGAGNESFRYFSRTDEEYRATYELIRQGKMPESETLLGQLLNKMLAPEDETKHRSQQIDGAKMPEYDLVRRYLGPAGMFVQSEDQGWLLTGIVLTKGK